ncbi:SDR family oxidoreductase [Cohnella phaseoli]|uniref:dTDP-4-dehydrorhamnose reductase n=1 Tax=Cohnella phaseoli TaxID=456490 RepID=A0A3D9KCI2_9BACL|nr:NAD(P)-dependent oxidoreductase [Cohnella phaseoli]RED83982.1 dTDP-4-dehydrorhamnose reductase [Cohnella phaseoli]
MSKILITGSDGMLGTDLIKHCHDLGYETLALNRKKLDITDRASTKDLIESYKPTFVIHTAALTNVDFCEQNDQVAFQVNGCGTENIAYYSNKVNATVVYISSCGLFGDEIRAYSEHDNVQLKTKYAKSKYMGEQKAIQWCDRYFVVRPGWLFGGNINHKKNFVYNRYLESLNNSSISSAVDKFGCPTYTKHLSTKITDLLNTDYYGTYHITNQGFCSRYDYVKTIIDNMGIKTEVKQVDSKYFIRNAPVPDSEILNNNNLSSKSLGLLPSWESALEEYIRLLKSQI